LANLLFAEWACAAFNDFLQTLGLDYYLVDAILPWLLQLGLKWTSRKKE